MDATAGGGFLRFFGEFEGLDDPRAGDVTHRLHDMVVVAILAVICGCDGWAQVELFGRRKHKWLATFLALPGGIPSHDTFGRVFARLDPEACGKCVAEWVAGVCEAAGLKHIGIDGKACRSEPRNTCRGCLHLVSAWAAENRLI